MIISFDSAATVAPGAPRTTVVRAGEWTIAILRRDASPGGSEARWVIAEAFGYLSGDEGLAFATLFHARCWFICRLAQSGRTLLRGQGASRASTRHDVATRALH
ncbi:hypothetical protein KZ813_17395 [Sphingomonas sp. RHCKR7]|uniref:hypothetical protein n=1 Tax=Sphingomonas folli TaxID=2862497 RepID=UPI001CA57C07|nr:hypothetical protein [Sphingomonas folli]MBW6528620.1 hypothetical protein [Sphingomonas folli]